MKKIVVIGSFALCLCFVTVAKETIYVDGKDKLPKIAQEFIEKALPNEYIVYVKVNKNIFGIGEFQVIMSSGVEIEFNDKGSLEGARARKIGIPQGIVSEKIWIYIKQNYKTQDIIKLRKKKDKTQVVLSNKVELYFDENGIKQFE